MRIEVGRSNCRRALSPWQAHAGFETVIFDECAQAGELATLIPLQYGAKLALLVGDPQQLPATVKSAEAKARLITV